MVREPYFLVLNVHLPWPIKLPILIGLAYRERETLPSQKLILFIQDNFFCSLTLICIFYEYCTDDFPEPFFQVQATIGSTLISDGKVGIKVREY
jgi:hypothetical protein